MSGARRKFILLATLAVVAAQPASGQTVGGAIPRTNEILLQFFFITILGSMFTFWLSALRDRKSRHESALSALRDLIKQVDDLYRTTKQIKRMIRSRLKMETEGHVVEAGFFAARMDDLSNTQLKLEQVRNTVRTRPDLFNGDRKSRVLREIQYAEKYLRDVVEEFEKRCIVWDGNVCRISASCTMLNDFLGERWMPPEYEADFVLMEDADTSEERFNAFQCILNKVKRADPEQKRHKTISDECVLLAIREIREIIAERQAGSGRLSLIRLRRRKQGLLAPFSGSAPITESPS